MTDSQTTSTLEGDQNEGTQDAPTTGNKDNTPNVDEKTKAFTREWVARIKSAKKHYKGAFDQMTKNMQLAKDGASEEWSKGDHNYTVPIVNRLVNQAVAQLYAKNPKAYAKRRKRRVFTVWDGQIASLNEAEMALKQGAATGMPPDPNVQAIIQDAEQVKAYDTMMDGIADTLNILFTHYIEDPAAQYKQLFKAMVRRSKVCSVGYVKLCFQRILEKNPDITSKIDETTQQIATLETLKAERADDQFDDDSAKMEELTTLLKSLQEQETLIVAEGPLYSFPRSKSIIVDPACTHLKTLTGANWIAEEWEKTPSEVLADYKVDISGQFTTFTNKDSDNKTERWSDESCQMEKPTLARGWRVQNRKTGLEFTICEGYPGYLKAPVPPAVKLPRFWDIFPLVFNEIEHETELFPPSDVHNSRHMAAEYNRSRQGLREHRQANRPAYFTTRGSFEEADLKKIEFHPSHAVIECNQIAPNEKIQDKLMAKPIMPILKEQYDTSEIFTDILRVTGDQQANEGPTTTATATESSIAEQSRSVGISDNVDDIDDMLSLLAQSTAVAMLLNLSKETVIDIVGPGAVWPDLPQSREEIVEDITLDVRAGSSGRPNAPAELQKIQTAMPFIIQMPNVNPTPITQRYLDLLDIDIEGAIVEGLPSIQTLNAIMSNQQPQAPGSAGAGAQAPGAQGPQGQQNAPQAPGTPPGPQAPHPAPVPAGNMANGAPMGRA